MRDAETDSLDAHIRLIEDFPSPGILFRDVTPLLADATALDAAIGALAERVRPLGVDCVVAAEARGFILGPALARELNAGFAPARRPGRLPARTLAADYSLEYARSTLELHADALAPGARVLVHDDLLATGGTALAVADLARRAGGDVAGYAFLIELTSLGGRERLAPLPVRALIADDRG